MRSVIRSLTALAWATFASTATAAGQTAVWSGFYVGANLGGARGNIDSSFAFYQSPNSLNSCPCWTLTATDSNSLSGGILGGGQVGYNWQFGKYVLGIEADFQGTHQTGSHSFAGVFIAGINNASLTGNNAVAVAYTGALKSLGTLRYRWGYTNGDWLFYTTGGLAYGHIASNGSLAPASFPGGGNFFPPPNIPAVWNQSSTRAGATFGAGIERALWSRWSLKVEYLFVDLWSLTANSALPAGNCYGTPGKLCNTVQFPGPGTSQFRFTDSIIRVGLNYHFH